MKEGIKEILGKTIKGVVVKRGQKEPRSQVFLIFSDNTNYEFYCYDSTISGTTSLGKGDIETVKKYSPPNDVVLELYDENIGK